MTLVFWFWVIYVVGFLFSAYRERIALIGAPLFWWVLIALLGIAVFGGPVK